MKSEAFRRFLDQLRAQGPEKGDGFDQSCFAGLVPEERLEVRRLLRDALLAGDNTAAAGLVLFDRAGAELTLRDVLQQLSPDSGVRAEVAGELWTLTRDVLYQQALVECLASPRPAELIVSLSYLRSTPPNSSLVPALRTYLLRESDPRRRSIAAGLFLYWLDMIPTPDDAYRLRRSFMDAMKSSDVGVRQSALDALGEPAAV